MELSTHDAGVGGSSPPVATILIQWLMQPAQCRFFRWKCGVSAAGEGRRTITTSRLGISSTYSIRCSRIPQVNFHLEKHRCLYCGGRRTRFILSVVPSRFTSACTTAGSSPCPRQDICQWWRNRLRLENFLYSSCASLQVRKCTLQSDKSGQDILSINFPLQETTSYSHSHFPKSDMGSYRRKDTSAIGRPIIDCGF